MRHQFRELVTGVLLLSGNEVAVLHGERMKGRRREEIRPRLSPFVYDAKGQDVPADNLVGKVFFAVGEASHALAADHARVVSVFQIQP